MQETVRKLAAGEKKSTNEYLDEVIRFSVEMELQSYIMQTLPWNQVGAAQAIYESNSKSTCQMIELNTPTFGEIKDIQLPQDRQKMAV